MESRFLKPFLSNLPITRTKSCFPSSAEHCNFIPDFSTYPIFRTNFRFPSRFKKSRFHCITISLILILVNGLLSIKKSKIPLPSLTSSFVSRQLLSSLTKRQRFYGSISTCKIRRICMENHWRHDWRTKGLFPIQILLIFDFHKKSPLKGCIPENVHVLSISDNNIA